MFKHLLVATDGSEASDHALRYAADLAGRYAARLSVLHVVAPFEPLLWPTYPLPSNALPSAEEYEADTRRCAERVLAAALERLRQAGVAAESCIAHDAHAWRGIVATAAQRGCDGIVMASHGRRGLDAMILGSETQKVLTHTTLPVLVVR